MTMPIELRLLRYFSVVAEELHVGHAAARLYISQPALSQQIRALEEQVGLPLLVRHPRACRSPRPARRFLSRRTRCSIARGGSTLLPELLGPLRATRPD